MNHKRIAVIGLGNILLMDEGVGVHVVNAVQDRYPGAVDVDFIDGGTMGLDLLPYFEERQFILIVDAADFKQEPGHIGLLTDEQIPAVLNAKLSMHHVGLNDIIFAARLKGIATQEICLLGIQPQTLELGLEMTATIQAQVQTLMDMVLAKLEQWRAQLVSEPLTTS